MDRAAGSLLFLFLAGACGGRTPSAAQARVDSALVQRPMTAAEVAASQTGGSRVDTILVSPAELTIHVGETVVPFFALSFRALDSSGSRIRPFAPALIHQHRHATERAGAGLRGIRPGADTVYVEALPRDPGAQPLPRRPSTRVLIRVVP